MANQTTQTFNDLLKNNPDAAADKIVDGLRLLINTSVPNVYMSKVEWLSILPKVVEKMTAGAESDSTEDEAPEETSDEDSDEEDETA